MPMLVWYYIFYDGGYVFWLTYRMSLGFRCKVFVLCVFPWAVATEFLCAVVSYLVTVVIVRYSRLV
jgi:hypothetical protein